MSDKKTIIKSFQSMKPSIVFKQLDYSKLPKEVRDKMKGDLSGVSDDTLDLQFEQSTFKKWIETFADLYPAAFGIKEDVKVVSVAPVAKVEPVAAPVIVAEEKPVDTSELETKIKDLETRLSVVNKMILKQPLKKTELKIRVKTIEKMIAKFKEELKKTKTASKKKVLKKSLGGFLFGALGGFIVGQLVDLKLQRKKVRFDLGGTLEGDKKYQYSVTYQTITPESAEEGDFDSQGFEVEKTIDELQDILQEAVNRYYIHEPSSTKNGKPVSGTWWSSVSPDTNRDYFEKGIEKYYSLHVSNIDGTELSDEEAQLITNKLKEGRKLHWDEEEKNWWKDGGEIHSKDTDGILLFKADTKGGKYSIEVREGSNVHGTYYDTREYTNGSARGVSSISNKELLMHKLADTIIGSKKIDSINYIISFDNLGLKEYLPALEKIWDIYNSKEIRDWWVSLPQETKDELTKYSKEKAINYVKDNNYRYDDSTIGSFANIFRREKMVKDFYESKGMVMLKDGGELKKIIKFASLSSKINGYDNIVYEDENGLSFARKAEFERGISPNAKKLALIQSNGEVVKYENGGEIEKYETLTFKTRKKAEQNEKEIKDYFDSRFIKSEVLLGKDERGNEGFYVKYQLKKELGDKFENGGGVGKKSYEITFEDVWSFATAKRNAELTDAQYSKAIKQMENKDVVVDKYNEKQGIHEQLRIKKIVPKYAKGGSIQSEINDLYSKSNFINDDFNWKIKLLEMLQDRSVEAYNIYQSLNEIQKEEVLQALFEADNDMGSDGDGEISTSKENLEILLEDAKNGNKYSNGGGVSEWKFNVGDKVMLTPLTFFSKKGFERYDLTKPVTIVGRKKVALNTDGEYRLDNTTVNNEYFIKVLDSEEGLPIVTANENELTLVTEYSNGGGFEKALENLHAKASSSTTPRGKNKINIPHISVGNTKKEYAVYKLSLGQPSYFWNEDENKFIWNNPEKATLYNEKDAYYKRDELLKPLIDNYQKTGKNYSEIHVGNLYEKKILKYSKGGGVNLDKDKFSLTSINNDLVEMVIGENWTAKEFKEHFLNKGYELKPDNSIVGFYFAKPDGQTFQLVPSFHKKGEIIKYENGGKIGKLSTTYSNPLEYLKAMGAKVDSDLNYSTEKNGINYYIGFKGDKALVVAFIEDEDNYMIDKEDAREMSLSAKIKGIEIVELYTNYGIELHSKEKTKDIGFDKIFKVSVGFKDGGSISSDNTPKVYIADLAAYNEGKLVGEWLDLSEFGSGEEVMQKISELLKEWSKEAGEEREEYSVHDMENFPKQMYSEGMGEDSFQKVIDYWEAINGTDYPMEVVEEFASLTGEDVVDAANKMKDAYYGKFDDVEDFAREYVDSVGGIEGVSNPEQYIDISETDKRIISSEEADNRVDDMSDDDILEKADLKEIYDNFIERADELGEDEELDDDDRIRTLESEFGYSDSDEILEEAKESVREEISSEWEKGLRDPYNFLVEEQGIYDASSIMKANFIMFDYKKFGEDLEQDYYAIEHDGEVYVFSQNYKKGGSLPSSRSLGVSIEKIEIDIPEFRPEKLKEQTKTNKKPKTMAKKSAGSNKNKERMTMIQSEAKKIWAEGKLKKYSEAVSLASKKLKKEGKL